MTVIEIETVREIEIVKPGNETFVKEVKDGMILNILHQEIEMKTEDAHTETGKKSLKLFLGRFT